MRTRFPALAEPTAQAAAQVVFPTPPFPPKKTNRDCVGRATLMADELFGNVGFNAGDPDIRRGHRDAALLRTSDLANPGKNVALGFSELLVRDFAKLQAHLRLE